MVSNPVPIFSNHDLEENLGIGATNQAIVERTP
jgi:hypothetical protein